VSKNWSPMQTAGTVRIVTGASAPFFALVITCLTPIAGNAYTAAGDRNFVANLLLPQIAPSDAFWGNFSTQPKPGQFQGTFGGTYSQTITERLGIQLEEGIQRQGNLWVAQPFDLLLRYEAINNQPHELVLSFQVDHLFGGTGTSRTNPSFQSATQLGVTFGKGLGDLPVGYWRPLAITGWAGYQIAQGTPVTGAAPRPNTLNTGFSIQYSIPYLVSKVANVNLPPFLRGITPITEVLYSTPTGSRHAHDTTLQIAPGISYSQGRGWELGIEAVIPATRAAGTGIGVFAQLVVQFDYLLPDSIIGRPIFP
jgi:hypothetical protein